MKIKTIKRFFDRERQKLSEIGEKYDVNKKRAEELIYRGLAEEVKEKKDGKREDL